MDNPLDYPKRPRLPRKGTWLITFGDLLTLLLCFFIATIASQKPLAAVTGRNQNEIGREHISTPLEKSGTVRGTQLALSPSIALCVGDDLQGKTNDERLVRSIELAHEMQERVRHVIDTGVIPGELNVVVGGKGCTARFEVTRFVETKSTK